MIVLLDTKVNKLLIYTQNGLRSLSFNNIEAMKQIIGKEKVLYVTSATSATAEDIIKVSNSFSTRLPKNPSSAGDPEFLRSSSRGYVCLTMNDGQTLTLEGPAHFIPLKKLYEDFGKDIFTKNKVLGNMLAEGKLQIVTRSEANKLKSSHINELNKKQKLIDQSLDNILVDGSVDSYLDSYDGDPSAGHDAVEIQVKGGIGGGNATSNEGSLLPDDFDGASGQGAASNEGNLLPDDFEG